MNDNTMRFFEPATRYRVVPIGHGRQIDALRLRDALSKGLVARRDPNREGFYSVELGEQAFYIHTHEATKTLYILSAAPREDFHEETGLSHSIVTSDCVPS